MGADVLRINIIAKFERWCFVSSVVLKNPHYAKPRTVMGNAMTTVPQDRPDNKKYEIDE